MRTGLRNCYRLFIIAALMIVLSVLPVQAADTPSVTDTDVITLSPEQFAKNYKKLKGYKVHTVVWLEHYTFGSAFAATRKDSDKTSFQFTGKMSEKPEKGQYIEVIGFGDGKSMGYIYLDDATVLSTGATAESVLKQIDEDELVKKQDINAFTSSVDQMAKKKAESEAKSAKKKFDDAVSKARKEFESSKDILTLTPKQLYENHKELAGRKFHSVFTVSDVREAKLTAKLDQDDWLNSFYFYFDESEVDLTKYINKKDIVELIGVIKPGSGNTLDYTSCRIISVGKDAKVVLDTINKNEKDEQAVIDKLLAKESEKKKADEATSKKETAPVKVEFVTLSEGDNGDSVKAAQELLLALGYLTSSPDGSFGSGTKQAVIDFQNTAGLKATGTIDKKTYDALSSKEAPKKKETEPSFQEIKRGDSGEDVVTIQKRLIELNYLSGSADGSFGSGTEKAVREFQAANGTTETGIIDENTYNALMESSAPAKIIAAAPQIQEEVTRSEPMVWIPTNGGKKYHTRSSCSGMIDPRQVTLSEAVSLGFEPCKRCH